METQKYQLLSPIMGNKIYQTNDINKVVKKCYDELKMIGGKKDYSEIVIMNVDNYETFRFNVSKKQNTEQIGGNMPLPKKTGAKTETNPEINNESMPSNMIETRVSKIEEAITNLAERIRKLEGIESGVGINENITDKVFVKEDRLTLDKPELIREPLRMPENKGESYRDRIPKIEPSIKVGVNSGDVYRTNLQRLEEMKTLERKNEIPNQKGSSCVVV
jgi:hypothetical protein